MSAVNAVMGTFTPLCKDGIIRKAGTWILNRVFGVCPKRQITKTVTAAGEKLVNAARNGATLNVETVGSIFTASMPKGVKAPRLISKGKEVFDFFAANKPDTPKAAVSALMETARATHIPGIKTDGVIFLPEVLTSSPADAIALSTHEFRHYLDIEKGSILSMLIKLRNRFFPRCVKKVQTKYGVSFNTAYVNLQRRLGSDLGLAANSGLVSGFQTNVIELNGKKIISYMRKLLRNETAGMSMKDRIKFLKLMRCVTRTEAKAYTAGGKAANSFMQGEFPIFGREHSSEVLGVYQAKLLDAIEKELHALKNPRFRRMKCFSVAKNGRVPRPKVVEELHKSIAANLDGVPYVDTQELGGGIGSLLGNPNSAAAKRLATAWAGDGGSAVKVTTWDKLRAKA